MCWMSLLMTSKLMPLANVVNPSDSAAVGGARQDGRAQSSREGVVMSAALPEVSGSFGEKPALTFPADAPSGELEVLVLSRGDGALVEAGDTIEVHYLG